MPTEEPDATDPSRPTGRAGPHAVTNEPVTNEPVNTEPVTGAHYNGLLGGLPKIIKFDSLARCGDEIWIENEGQIYRLRKTRQGKLILTK